MIDVLDTRLDDYKFGRLAIRLLCQPPLQCHARKVLVRNPAHANHLLDVEAQGNNFSANKMTQLSSRLTPPTFITESTCKIPQQLICS